VDAAHLRKMVKNRGGPLTRTVVWKKTKETKIISPPNPPAAEERLHKNRADYQNLYQSKHARSRKEHLMRALELEALEIGDVKENLQVPLYGTKFISISYYSNLLRRLIIC
jgi:hypothetical protein